LSDKQDIAFVVDDNPEEIVNLNKIGILAFSWEQLWNEDVYPKLFVDRDITREDENVCSARQCHQRLGACSYHLVSTNPHLVPKR
jgi:hypothetical protein